MKKFIEFKQQRELGDILSDTFTFIRSEYKPYFNIFFRIVGPYLAALLVSYAMYLYVIGDPSKLFLQPIGGLGPHANPFMILIVGAVFLLCVVAAYAISQATTLFYIQSYATTKGTPDFSTIKNEVYAHLGQFLGLGVLVGLCVGVGFMCCIIPGVYLYVPLILSFSILVFDRKSATEAFSYSFNLVKGYWWATFASLLVVGIIVTVASFVFAIPVQVYSFLKLGILSGEVNAESIGIVDPLTILLSIISTLAQFLFNIITSIATVLIYFDLNERKNFTGTYERIKNLGATDD